MTKLKIPNKKIINSKLNNSKKSKLLTLFAFAIVSILMVNVLSILDNSTRNHLVTTINP